MKAKMNAKDIIIPAVALFLIALVATALLAVVNMLTSGKIAEQEAASEAAARQSVMTDAASFDEKQLDGDFYFEAKDKDGNVVGFVFNTVGTSKGYAGALSVTVGIDTNGVITGIVPGDLSNETPGLGQNANKESFKSQFVGKSGEVKVDKDGGEIVSLTSATITSRAITSGVQEALNLFTEVTGGAK